MKISVLPFFLLLFISLTAQDSLHVRLEGLVEAGNYAGVIAEAEAAEEVDAESAFFLGIAQIANEPSDPQAAIGNFQKALENEPESIGANYYLSIAQVQTEQYAAALQTIRKALALEKEDPDLWETKGDIFVNTNELDSAKVAYERAVALPNCAYSAYYRLAAIYGMQDQPTRALELYERAMANVQESEPQYLGLLYNLGLIKLQTGDFVGAEQAFQKYRKMQPSDLEVIPLLVQVLYQQEKYAATDSLRAVLYAAYAEKDLPESIEYEFMLDEFEWQDKTVYAFERYNEDGTLFYKHVFYLIDTLTGDYAETIQTEHSMAMDMLEDGKYDYVLGRDVYNPSSGQKLGHQSFFQYVFTKDATYGEIKKTVLQLLNTDDSPTSSSSFGTAEEGKKKKKKRKKKRKKRS